MGLRVTFCDVVVLFTDNLTLDKIDLKNIKSLMFQSFIYIMHNLYPSLDFDTSNSPKLHCFEFKQTIGSSTPFLKKMDDLIEPGTHRSTNIKVKIETL